MEGSTVHQAFWILKIVAWALILGSSLRLHLIRKYRLLFVYVFSSMVFEVVMSFMADTLGTNSLEYSYLYVGTTLITAGLAVAVLLMIYFKIHAWSPKRDWHLIAVPASVAVIRFSQADAWVWVRLLDVSYAVLSYIGLAALVRMKRARHIDLGWNLKVVLLALTIPAVFYSLIFVVYTAGLALSKQQAGLWMNGVAVSSWIILAIGLSEFSPPRLIARPGLRASAPRSEDGDISERSAVPQCSL